MSIDKTRYDDRDTQANDNAAPEVANSEQDETGEQAQDVAADALSGGNDLSEDSERGGGGDRGAVMPDDTPDLVETMEAMNRSGHIDMGAFAGEPMMDDEEDIRGETDNDDDE